MLKLVRYLFLSRSELPAWKAANMWIGTNLLQAALFVDREVYCKRDKMLLLENAFNACFQRRWRMQGSQNLLPIRVREARASAHPPYPECSLSLSLSLSLSTHIPGSGNAMAARSHQNIRLEKRALHYFSLFLSRCWQRSLALELLLICEGYELTGKFTHLKMIDLDKNHQLRRLKE
ncbi:hypothetical protein O6H91_14G064500 [Diphasiastrum complanatum]|uniref:Uncharacterized protein n=2 Tax=Diphasiastrum complanatum TaxID=34168 RepID=A0ACC2BQ44_DIPCM|nr:hypothetical protein O6H91_14G063400 [Diphasiastrum complanatum]KAJ7531917.1 hypothetical protein O6H91_14G064500 [Diphasiastrum complanatum]